jgi:hypothetical protein
MGNYYSTNEKEPPIEEIKTESNNNKLDSDLENIISNELISTKNITTQTDDKSEFLELEQKFKNLEIEKNEIENNLKNLQNKYETLLLKIDSEEIIKQIIKKIN